MNATTPPDRPRLRDLLEPEALHPSFPENDRDHCWEQERQASQAISLKRIADTLAHFASIDTYTFARQIGLGLEHGKSDT